MGCVSSEALRQENQDLVKNLLSLQHTMQQQQKVLNDWEEYRPLLSQTEEFRSQIETLGQENRDLKEYIGTLEKDLAQRRAKEVGRLFYINSVFRRIPAPHQVQTW
eukprot:TRINITY_DN4702_c0_g1_i1.p1 TRINITY_DN4702_c0_g1~~TRINITY_DN4702_c0_g1_i1.p1  ORF type:complete len:106 (-),score=20.23 TRINITY_DN4702_c0_g1_i1:63-380(-)